MQPTEFPDHLRRYLDRLDNGSGLLRMPDEAKDALLRMPPPSPFFDDMQAINVPTARPCGPHPDIIYRRTHSQGRLTASVHGSHVHVTVSLRSWWTRLLDWTPSDALLRRAAGLYRRTASICDLWCTVAIVCALVYFIAVIGQAFLPGGAVERVLGGPHAR